MLFSLKIKNLAIIDEIEIDFYKGLNVITGETGAGKTIFLNSILLLLGKKFNSKDIIRFGEDTSVVEALLYNNNDEVIVKRVISRDGRNKIYLNGSFVSANELKNKLGTIIEFAGQNQNQILFKKETQIDLLDTFGGLSSTIKEYQEIYKEYKKILKKIENFEQEKSSNQEKIDLYKYQLEQLNSANLLDIEEEEKLIKDIELAENIELIKTTLNDGYFEIIGRDNSLLKTVSSLKNRFSEITNIKSSYGELVDILTQIEISLEEAGNIILKNSSEITDEHFSLDDMYQRLNLIKNLKKRFNKNSIDELLKLKNELENYLKSIEEEDFDIDNLKEKIKIFEKELEKYCMKIREKRKDVKKIFENEMKRHLNELKMGNVNFNISLKELEFFTDTGKDEVEFLIATNDGEPLKPLNKVVSGGELSRIMLALKTILTNYFYIPVLIFDEVDSGTGGETAFAIGKKLKEISLKHQVFVITHLPQVAAFADTHYKIEKFDKNGRTVSQIRKLSNEERVKEIARMISGETITDKALESAKEMIDIRKVIK